jgi:1-acyl-sn-glycerol-3-phosphate acyltransferase
MPNTMARASKPRSETIRPGLTRLPARTPWRRALRVLARWLARLVVRLATRTRVIGLENLPRRGPALVVSNHLGDADLVVGIAFSPVFIDTVSKVELYDLPVLGRLMDAFGVIWVHRGQPDRNALRSILAGLKEGRLVAIAPEGRESVTGSLEEGTGGAAYLALKTGAPVVPVTFTGTENWRIYGNIKHFRRTEVTVNVGPPFRLEDLPDRRQAIEHGTETIMNSLAGQLPPEYRGIYQRESEEASERA